MFKCPCSETNVASLHNYLQESNPIPLVHNFSSLWREVSSLGAVHIMEWVHLGVVDTSSTPYETVE